MTYEGFKEEVLKELRDFYGKDATVDICEIRRNNGQCYDGVQIVLEEAERYIVPVISLNGLYEAYYSGDMEMDDCIEKIYRERKKYEATENIRQFAGSLMDWEAVKEHIYPILLSTKENEELLKELVSFPMLDLSVAYIIRLEISEGHNGNVKVKQQMLNQYEIEAEQLHKQAMKNLEKDGYKFQDMQTFIKRIVCHDTSMEECVKGRAEDDAQDSIYILTNSLQTYGAAGILNKKLLREFAGSQNFFILPSSIHETLFVPAYDPSKQKLYDSMVMEVNGEHVDLEERLSDHCYYYDGQTEEIRICA